MKNGYCFDALNNTLTISNSFAKKASQIGTTEYAIVLKLRNDYPTLKIQKEEKTTATKQITFKMMEEFINGHRNAKALKTQFDGVRKLSKFHAMPYMFVKDWFEDTFPYFKEGNYALDKDGYIVDSATLINEIKMVQEVAEANDSKADDAIPAEGLVA